MSLINYGLEGMLCWSWQETIGRLVSTLGKILASGHPSYTKILTLLITYITEIRRTFCTLEKLITWIELILNCDIACSVYVNLKLIGKILTLLQPIWNSVVPSSSHKLHDRAFHSLSSCSFPFLMYVRHSLNHTIVFLSRLCPSDQGSRLVRLMQGFPTFSRSHATWAPRIVNA